MPRLTFRLWFVSLLLAIIITPRVKAEPVAPGSQLARQYVVKVGTGDETREVTLRYWLFVPKSYADGKRVPLMLFLHGAGERGDNLELVKKWGPPKKVAKEASFPFLLISPQCKKGKRWDVEEMALLVKHVAGAYRVDHARMYCTGLSMGGYGTWALLAAQPELFAAGIPICGGGDPSTAKSLAKVPLWVFHGDKDQTVPLKRSEQMVTAIKEADGNVRLTVYPGVGHNSWSATYGNPKTYEWLLSHSRKVR
jgi:predicted peptidase